MCRLSLTFRRIIPPSTKIDRFTRALGTSYSTWLVYVQRLHAGKSLTTLLPIHIYILSETTDVYFALVHELAQVLWSHQCGAQYLPWCCELMYDFAPFGRLWPLSPDPVKLRILIVRVATVLHV